MVHSPPIEPEIPFGLMEGEAVGVVALEKKLYGDCLFKKEHPCPAG
jgi:hypothetical protein